MNIYENCPTLESEHFTLRLIENEDTADLFKVYSDPKAVPFFNSDNCNGDDFYYKTMELMQQAVDFWVEAYKNGWFVRWTIIDKMTKEAVGTIEAFHRDSDDVYDGYGLFRLDLRSDYEKRDIIANILKLLEPKMYPYFNCIKCMTKAIPEAAERVAALKEYGFEKSEEPLLGGHDRVEYGDYWVRSQK